MGTELSPLTHGTSASTGGSFERHVISPSLPLKTVMRRVSHVQKGVSHETQLRQLLLSCLKHRITFIPSTVQISWSKGPRKIFLWLYSQDLGVSNSFSSKQETIRGGKQIYRATSTSTTLHRHCLILNNARGWLVSLHTRRKCDIITAYFLLCNMNLIGHFSMQYGY